MSEENWFSTGDHKNREGVNGRVLLTGLLSLSSVVVFVFILHIYARCALRRRARRRATAIGELSTGTTAAETRAEPPKRGLDPSVIATLPIFVYKLRDRMDDDDAVECPICLTALEQEDVARLLPNCKHIFHAECIDMWLHSHSTCPNCRIGAELKAPEENRQLPEVPVGASAPPLSHQPERQESTMATENTSDVAGQFSKAGGSGPSRLSSVRRMLSWERSERRSPHSCGQAEVVEDLERQ